MFLHERFEDEEDRFLAIEADVDRLSVGSFTGDDLAVDRGGPVFRDEVEQAGHAGVGFRRGAEQLV